MRKTRGTCYSISQILEQLMEKELDKKEFEGGRLKKYVDEEVGYIRGDLKELKLEIEKLKEKRDELRQVDEEKREEIKEENKQKKRRKKPKSYICECGEEVKIRENVKRSWWDSIEWVICPDCGESRKKEDIYKDYLLKGENK